MIKEKEKNIESKIKSTSNLGLFNKDKLINAAGSNVVEQFFL